MAAVAVFLAGFGGLLAFWLLGDWPTDNGLFDYRSATIGDGLILPLIAGILLAAIIASPRSPADRTAAWTGVVVGALLGAATQAAWLADDSPNLNWTLPAPHEFNAPGWYHAVFLSLAGGALLGLSLLAATRIRAMRKSDERRVERFAASPWLGVLLAASASLVGLIAVDNNEAADTRAGMASMAGLGIGGLTAACLLVWTFGRSLSTALPNLAVGFAAALGVTAVAAWGLDAPAAIGVVTVVAALTVSLGLSYRREWKALYPAGAAALVLLGGSAACYRLVDDHGFEALIVTALAAAAATLIGGLRQRRTADNVLVGFAVFYVFGVLAVAAWLSGRTENDTEAAVAVGACITVLDIVVLSLVRDRYRAFAGAVQRSRQHGGEMPPPNTSGDVVATWALIAGLAAPTLAALGVLFDVAGPILGANDVAGGNPPGLATWIAADIVLLVATAALTALAFSRRNPGEKFMMGLTSVIPRGAATGCLVLAAGIVTVALTQLHGPVHDPLAAGAVSIAIGLLVTEDLVSSPLRLQLAKVTPLPLLVSLAGGAMVAMSTFWLLTVGIWDGSQPAGVGGLLTACLLAIVPPFLCAGCFGAVIATGLRAPHLTEQPPWFNTVAQQMMYGVMTLIVIVVPFVAAGRINADEDLANPGLTVLATLGFLPALIAAVVWAAQENERHARSEEHTNLPCAIAKNLHEDAPPAETINDERKARLRAHVDFANTLIRGIVAFGVLWLGVNAL